MTNAGGLGLSWTATKSQSWLSLSAGSGTLAPGATAAITVAINSEANTLATGNYADTVAFRNTTADNATTTRSVNLLIERAPVTSLSLNVLPSMSPGQFRLQLSGQPGRTYYIEVTLDLIHWLRIVTNVAGPNGTFDVTDLTAESLPQRFYRGVAAP